MVAVNEVDLSVENCSFAECNIGDLLADAVVSAVSRHGFQMSNFVLNSISISVADLGGALMRLGGAHEYKRPTLAIKKKLVTRLPNFPDRMIRYGSFFLNISSKKIKNFLIF